MTASDKGSVSPGINDVTLQINLCAGDAAYAELTVPALVRAHPGVIHRLAVVDCCRPQRTNLFDPERRMPEGEFNPRLSRIRSLAEEFKGAGLFDEITYLEPGDDRFLRLAAHYCRPWMKQTHDSGGCGYMAYWAAIDLPSTRFVLHYDADMLVHQDPGFSWVDEALAYWPLYAQLISAVPRMSPPGFTTIPADDGPSCHEGRPREAVRGGWLNDWFSTRCFLLDRTRLAPLLPLISPLWSIEFRLRRLLDRGYPPPPELVLFRSLGNRGWRCLNLASECAWLLHPARKDQEYLRLLPGILASVAAGRIPAAQRGFIDLQLDAWSAFQASQSLP
jgi:hypothetical protein